MSSCGHVVIIVLPCLIKPATYFMAHVDVLHCLCNNCTVLHVLGSDKGAAMFNPFASDKKLQSLGTEQLETHLKNSQRLFKEWSMSFWPCCIGTITTAIFFSSYSIIYNVLLCCMLLCVIMEIHYKRREKLLKRILDQMSEANITDQTK